MMQLCWERLFAGVDMPITIDQLSKTNLELIELVQSMQDQGMVMMEILAELEDRGYDVSSGFLLELFN